MAEQTEKGSWGQVTEILLRFYHLPAVTSLDKSFHLSGLQFSFPVNERLRQGGFLGPLQASNLYTVSVHRPCPGPAVHIPCPLLA